ncbi:MAG: glycerophosphoryl diester phosphodiesterase membrane domain-containing protein [Lachnospiraceae bacterium]|nr:glycerophosphoryl diester phosphodiesterase membrane domain-containing protein [Lachnospiraceae bacterium]
MKTAKPQKEVKYRRLAAEAVPELWMVQFFSKTLLVLLSFLFGKLSTAIIGTRAAALTTANLKRVILSWQGVVLILVGIVFSLVYIAIDLFFAVVISGKIIRGEDAGFFSSLKESFISLKRFMNPDGISILLYILIAVPLVIGVIFSTDIMRNFQLPNFIMDVVWKRPLFTVLYVAGIAALIVVGFFFIFSVHAVLLSGKTPKEAKKYSFRLVKKHWLRFYLTMILMIVVMIGIRYAVSMLLTRVTNPQFQKVEETIPPGYDVPDLLEGDDAAELTEMDKQVISYRFSVAFYTLGSGLLDLMLHMVFLGLLMLCFTKLYLRFDREEQDGSEYVYLARPKRGTYVLKILLMIGVIVVSILQSLFIALLFDNYVERNRVAIYAHRAGGTLALENSVEGLKKASEHGCTGGEIDVQRTKDGQYIIYHDDDFRRLAGVKKKPSQMTLDEVMALELKDANGSGRVATLEEILDAAREYDMKLLVELKGETADERMADDVVAKIHEMGVEQRVILISLKQELMSYVKQTYPEFETSVVFFAGLGDYTGLDCDYLGVEEGIVNEALCADAHDKGKKVDVWTPNEIESIYQFLDSSADCITTDQVILAEKVQWILDNRPDRMVLEDRLYDFWKQFM